MNKELDKELLRYGEMLDDTNGIDLIQKSFIRIRIIKLNGKIYTHKMINGEVEEIKEIA